MAKSTIRAEAPNAIDREKLKNAVQRLAKPWAEAWQTIPDRERLTNSLLKGIEHRLLQKRGEVPSPYVNDPLASGSFDRMAFSQGQFLADEIPEQVVDALFVRPTARIS